MQKGQAKSMGKNSRNFENEVAKDLDYENIFLPQSVCDRIAIVDGRPIFIEIKQKGQKLRKEQNRFRELIGDNNYIVIEKPKNYKSRKIKSKSFPIFGLNRFFRLEC